MKLFKNKNNKIFAYEEDGSQDHLIPEDYIPITQVEADEIIAQNDVELQANISYAERRRTAYPQIGDQLDMLWHAINEGKPLDKTSDFYQQLLQVKQQYPKPES